MTVISRCETCCYVTLGRFGMRPDLLNILIRNSRLLIPRISCCNPTRRILIQPLLLPNQRSTPSGTFQSWHPNTTIFSLVISTPLLVFLNDTSNTQIYTVTLYVALLL